MKIKERGKQKHGVCGHSIGERAGNTHHLPGNGATAGPVAKAFSMEIFVSIFCECQYVQKRYFLICVLYSSNFQEVFNVAETLRQRVKSKAVISSLKIFPLFWNGRIDRQKSSSGSLAVYSFAYSLRLAFLKYPNHFADVRLEIPV